MSLIESYRRVRSAIVAFVPKYTPIHDPDAPLAYPAIIGTGFVAREDGIIVTNDHVLKAFADVLMPSECPPDEQRVYAILREFSSNSVTEIPLEIIQAATLDEFVPYVGYYGDKPDVAVLRVKARGLPALDIDTTIPPEGTELATAGFPMGTDALNAPGWIHQLTPTLQRGIVSAVLPFFCEGPHAFTLNVMTQGGASGSPVFYPETGSVAGVLYAGLDDSAITGNSDIVNVPTMFSYVVPSHWIAEIITRVDAHPRFALPVDAPTLDDMRKSTEVISAFGRGPQGEIYMDSNGREMDPRSDPSWPQRKRP